MYKRQAIDRPELIREAAEKFGSQCVVLAIDAKRKMCIRDRLWTDLDVRDAELQNREKSYSISFFRKNAHVVRKFIFLHRRRIRISEWQQFTE